MKYRRKKYAAVVLMLITLVFSLVSGGMNDVPVAAAGAGENESREMAGQSEAEKLPTDKAGYEPMDEGGANENTGQPVGEESGAEGDAGGMERKRKVTEILGMEKENLMEFEAGAITIKEALAMLPGSVDVKLDSGDVVPLKIKWNCECESPGIKRYRLEPDSDEFILGLPIEELPYVDISFHGIHTLEAYDPNTSSIVKLDKSLGCTADVVSYLNAHQSTYLGTPYSHLGTGLTESNCMAPGAGGSMNCTGFVAHVLKACGANLNKIPQRLPGHYLNASNWNDYAHNQSVQSYKYHSIAEALSDGKLEKGDVIYFEPRLWEAGDDCHIGFFWGDTPSQNRFWHSDHQGNRISEIVAKTANSYVYLFKITHEPQTGYLKVHKASSVPGMTSENQCYSLEGAVYTVYDTNKDGALSGVVGELRTDQNGDTQVLELPPETYYIKETVPPQGFETDERIYTVNITTAATKTEPLLVRAKDVPGYHSYGITITKIVDGEATSTLPTLEGTEFTMKYYDGYYTKENLPAAAKRTWVIKIKKSEAGVCMAKLAEPYLVKERSDELYYDGSVSILPYGTLTIQETKPAAGYTLKGYLSDANGKKIAADGEVYLAQITKESNEVKLDGGNTYTASDEAIPGRIRLRKYDTDGTSPLEGVTFELTDSKGKVVAAAVTNQDGEILFDNLYPDIYTITETKTVEGHTLLKDTITAEIPMRVTEKDMEDKKIDKGQCIYDEADDIYYVYDLTYEISNEVSFAMPMTGGTYTVWSWLPMAAGVVSLGFASILVFKKKGRVERRF